MPEIFLMKVVSILVHLVKCMPFFVHCNEFYNLTFHSDILLCSCHGYEANR